MKIMMMLKTKYQLELPGVLRRHGALSHLPKPW